MEWSPDPTQYPKYLRARIQRGLGVRSGTSYRPWKNIRDNGTHGGSAGCVRGIRVDRLYEILDQPARTYFFLLERAQEIVDIRESWPILDIDSTLRLSGKFGINHPKHGIYPEPICLDFLITEKGLEGLDYRAVTLAVDVKHLHARNRKLMQVTRQWCADHEIDWTVVDTSGLDRTVIDALRFIRGWYINRFQPDPEIADTFAKLFLDRYQNNLLLNELIELVRKDLRIDPEVALNLFRYCAWSHRIPVSLRARLAKNCPVSLLVAEND